MKTIFYKGIALAVVFFSLAFVASAQESKPNANITLSKVKVQHIESKNKKEARKSPTDNRRKAVRITNVQPLPVEKKEAFKQ